MSIVDFCTIVVVPKHAARAYLWYEHAIADVGRDAKLVLVRVHDPEGFRAFLCDEERGFWPKPGAMDVKIPDVEHGGDADWWTENMQHVIADTGSAHLCDHFRAATDAAVEQPYYFWVSHPEERKAEWEWRATFEGWDTCGDDNMPGVALRDVWVGEGGEFEMLLGTKIQPIELHISNKKARPNGGWGGEIRVWKAEGATLEYIGVTDGVKLNNAEEAKAATLEAAAAWLKNALDGIERAKKGA